jgi:isocitrate/isopropylmalate dehydrogenase
MTATGHLRISVQYVKQETLVSTDSGKEARATRLITERASRRIGTMAFELALARPRKVLVALLFTGVLAFISVRITASHHHTQVQRAFCHGRVVSGDRSWSASTS